MITEEEHPHLLCPGPPPGTDRHQEAWAPHATSQRSAGLGLKMDPELVWNDWNLQGGFTKTLVLKSIHSKQQMIRLRTPVTEFFTVLAPGTVYLSPGTSLSIPIRFKPLQLREYEDSIEFQSKEGSFRVCLHATVPRHNLELPESVLLPTCAVEHSSNATFLLRNVSKLQTFFQWGCKPPFQLSPEKGLLKPRQTCLITVVFQPQVTLLHQELAHCWFGEENKEKSSRTVLLRGEAKIPCLQIRVPGVLNQRDPVLSFGAVAVGISSQKHFEIFNPSTVTASFSLSPLTDWAPLSGLEFSCDITEGEVVPGGSVRADVTYTPTVVDSASVHYLSLKCKGGLSENLLKLTGSCVGPKVSLSASAVDFGCVEEGEECVRQMELINSSPAEAFYQWDLDFNRHSVFSIHPTSGIVRPHSHTSLKAVYRPTQSSAHHRRVPCLILHKDPVFLDLLGTCNSKSEQRSEEVTRKMELQRSEHTEQKSPMEDYYKSCLGCVDPLCLTTVTVEPMALVFNVKTSPSVCASWTSSQTVCVTNHTKLELRLVWTAAPDSPFSVFPPSCNLSSLKCTSFIVSYDPKQPNTVHAAQLECFAYYQGNHHNETQLLYPPYCMNVRVIGQFLQHDEEQIIPSCSFKPSRVVFPPLNVRSYQTALLQNCGAQPLTFCLDQSKYSSLAEPMAVVPSCGLIYPGGHQILTLRSNPTEDSPSQEFSVHLQLNAAEHSTELTVAVVMEKPSMSLEGDGSFYFQPTVVGSSTKRHHSIRNLSHLPLRFQWSIAETDQEFIFVKPDHGELHPNDSSVHMWSFSPLEEKEYTFVPKLTFWPAHAPECNASELTLTVTGVGSKGFIAAENALVDVGEIVVGGCQSVELPLVNQSPCSVSFCLSVEETVLDNDFAIDPKNMPNAIQLDFEKGTIASRSKRILQLTLKPPKQARYLWTISYQILSTTGCVISPPQVVCEVQAQAVFPKIQVVNVCGGGSLSNLSKLHLWNLLSLDSFNHLLLSNLSPVELTCGLPNKHSFTNTVLQLKLSAAPLNSEPSTVILMLYNPGSLSVDWAFLLPEEQDIKSGVGIANNTVSKVQPSQLFSIFPRSGTLLPGQQRAVHFRYRHDFVGTDQLPVVFQLSHGRELLLNFEGVTVERDGLYVVCPSNHHVFTSVFIGDCNPPKQQVYELYNGCSVPFCYQVDLTVLSQLQKDNYNHPLLRCLNPQGKVLPGQTVMLEWIFSPIEAKMYQIEIPIRISDGDSILVRFEGCGITVPALRSKTPFSATDMRTYEQCVQRRPFPEQTASLSEDSICLGDIPVSSRFSRLLSLTNISATDTIYYKWDMTNQQVVQIHPEQGSLPPGETAICVLTFTAAAHPKCYQLDVICQIIEETVLTQYHHALQHWEKEKQQHDFMATGRKLSTNTSEMEANTTNTKRPTLRKYKTLPPIAAAACEPVIPVCAKRAQRRAQREAALRMTPEPPRAALLHLEVTAHSHEHLECFTHFPKDFNKLHGVFRSLKSQHPGASVSNTCLPEVLPPLNHGPDRDTVMEVITSLIWRTLTEPGIMQHLAPSTFMSGHRQHQEEVLSHSAMALCPTTRRLNVQGGRLSGQRQQHSSVANGRSAKPSGTEPQTQNRNVHAYTGYDMCEDVLLKTIHNLVVDAVRAEFDLAAPPDREHGNPR